MKLVVIESPLKGHVPAWAKRIRFLARWIESFNRARNRRYAKACMRDSLLRGEAPYASHLIYDQAGILDDTVPSERERGMLAGFAWGARADLTAVYIDRGVSSGMERGMAAARDAGRVVELRQLPRTKGVFGAS
jgi:hypothetical protein